MNVKKKVLSAAVLAAMGIGSAQAVYVSQDGTGQVLIFPYYTVTNGNKTLISVVNTTDDFKAVKVRFREGLNSRDVLDFNLYLSPHDVWVASVEQDPEGPGARLMPAPNETSCTVPAIPVPSENSVGGVPFRNFAYTGGADRGLQNRSGPQGLERTREGYLEILEMGVANTAITSIWDRNGNGRIDIKHYMNDEGRMVPDNCQGLFSNFNDPARWGVGDNDVARRGMNAPTGGLMGSASVIHVESGVQIDVPVTALDGVFQTVMHFHPGTLMPSLDKAGAWDFDNTTAQGGVLGRHTDSESTLFVGRGLSSSQWIEHQDALDPTVVNRYNEQNRPNAGAFAVAAAMQARSVMNEFTVNPATEAETSWVLTMPIRWAFADAKRDGSLGSTAISPFTHGVGTNAQGLERFNMEMWDRDEFSGFVTQIDFSPRPQGTVQDLHLPFEVNVLNFGESNVFGTDLGITVPTTVSDNAGRSYDIRNGWARINFVTGAANAKSRWGHALVDGGSLGFGPVTNTKTALAYLGLPVIGFKATVLGNSNVGIGASYGTSTAHNYQREIRQIPVQAVATTVYQPRDLDLPPYVVDDFTQETIVVDGITLENVWVIQLDGRWFYTETPAGGPLTEIELQPAPVGRAARNVGFRSFEMIQVVPVIATIVYDAIAPVMTMDYNRGNVYGGYWSAN